MLYSFYLFFNNKPWLFYFSFFFSPIDIRASVVIPISLNVLIWQSGLNPGAESKFHRSQSSAPLHSIHKPTSRLFCFGSCLPVVFVCRKSIVFLFVECVKCWSHRSSSKSPSGGCVPSRSSCCVQELCYWPHVNWLCGMGNFLSVCARSSNSQILPASEGWYWWDFSQCWYHSVTY